MCTSKIVTDVQIMICYLMKRLDVISFTLKNYLLCHPEKHGGLSVDLGSNCKLFNLCFSLLIYNMRIIMELSL